MVESQLPKLLVAGSIPVSRSTFQLLRIKSLIAHVYVGCWWRILSVLQRFVQVLVIRRGLDKRLFNLPVSGRANADNHRQSELGDSAFGAKHPQQVHFASTI